MARFKVLQSGMGTVAQLIPHAGRLAAWLVRAVANSALPASLIYLVILDVYGVLLRFGLLEPGPVASDLPALLAMYGGLIMVLGTVWSYRTVKEMQPIHWWEELTDVRSSRWISVLGLLLVLVACLALLQWFASYYREIVLLGVLTGLPLLMGVLQRSRWHIVRIGRQDLEEIAKDLSQRNGQRRRSPVDPAAVANKIYAYNVGQLDPLLRHDGEALRRLPVGLTLRLPPDP